MPRDESTRMSMSDIPSIYGRYLVDMYYSAAQPIFTWENELVVIEQTEQLYGEIRKHNVPAVTLEPVPEGAPMEGITWSYETLKYVMTPYGREVRVRDGELQTARGRRLFYERVKELLMAFRRTVKLHIHSAVHNAPLFAKQMADIQGYPQSINFRDLSTNRYKYFGILDTEHHIYVAHTYKQEEGLAAGLGATPYTDVVVPRSSFPKMLLNKHATEAYRFGEGAVDNLKSASKYDHTFIPGLRVWPHTPEYIPMKDTREIDFFTRELYVAGWAIMDKSDSGGKLLMYNGGSDTHTELQQKNVIRYLPEFDEKTGTFSSDFYAFAQEYRERLRAHGFSGDDSYDPFVWKDDTEGSFFHVAETYGEVEEKFRGRQCDEEVGIAFAKGFLKENKNNKDADMKLRKLLEWQKLLWGRKDPSSPAVQALAQALFAARDRPRGDFGVVPLPNRNDILWPAGEDRYPYGYATVDCLFQIASMQDNQGWDETMYQEIKEGVEVLRNLEKYRKRVCPSSRIAHSDYFDSNDNSPATESNRAMFAALSIGLDTRPKTRLWVETAQPDQGRDRSAPPPPGDISLPSLDASDAEWQSPTVLLSMDAISNFFPDLPLNRTRELGRMIMHPAINAAAREVFLKADESRRDDYNAAWTANYGSDYAQFKSVRDRRPDDVESLSGTGTFQYFVLEEILRYPAWSSAENLDNRTRRSTMINLLAFALNKGLTALHAYDRGEETSTALNESDLVRAQVPLPREREEALSDERQAAIGDETTGATLSRRAEEFTKIDLSLAPEYFRSDRAGTGTGTNVLPSHPTRPDQPILVADEFKQAEAQFGLQPGETHRESFIKMELSTALLLDAQGPFYTRDGYPALKKNLVNRVREVMEYVTDPIQRYGIIHTLFSEISVDSASRAVSAGMPNPLGSILLFFPFVKLVMSAAIWFIKDSQTGKLLHTRQFFYQGNNITTTGWVYKMLVWIGAQIQKYENINVQPDVSHRKYLSGLDHSFYTPESYHKDLEDPESGYSRSLFAVCTGCEWGRNEALRLNEISMLGTHIYEDRDSQLNVEDEMKYRPKDGPYYPGALYTCSIYALKATRALYGSEVAPTYAQLREEQRIDFVCRRQQTWAWNPYQSDWHQETTADKPFVNVDKIGDGLYSLYNYYVPTQLVM
jgi:hypothetical protein